MSKLIIISGGEATGKSHIRDELAKRLKIKYLSKDIIKEKMFDEGPVSTWRFSWYENCAKDELFRQIKDCLGSGQPFIIEANFKRPDQKRFKKLLEPTTETYEFFCYAKNFEAFRRFVRRNESGRRHPGHHDRRWYLVIFLYSLSRFFGSDWPYKPLSENVLRIDTTDAADIDYDKLIRFITRPI
jgi:predicted kinase